MKSSSKCIEIYTIKGENMPLLAVNYFRATFIILETNLYTYRISRLIALAHHLKEL